MEAMHLIWTGVGVAVVTLGCWGAVRRCRTRHVRQAAHAMLQALAQQFPFENHETKKFPPSVGGHYYDYPITVECKQEKTGWLWRVHSELESSWDGRLFLHGEDRPAAMREIYGMEVVLTGDADFDRSVVLASDHEALARQLMTRYVRKRYRQLHRTHFQIDIRNGTVYAEFHTTTEDGVGRLPNLLDLLISTVAMLDVVVGDVGPS
jgi:hypothetical protein